MTDPEKPAARPVTVEGDFLRGGEVVIRIFVQGEPMVTLTVEDALGVAMTIPGIVEDMTT